MIDNEINIRRLTTDRSISIKKLLKEKYKDVQHLFDAWHLLKSKIKDLRDKGKLKKSAELLEFLKSIKNHLWWCIKAANGDGILARELLLGLLFHIIGIHEWEKGNISEQLHNAIANKIGNDKKKNEFFLKRNPTKCSALFQVCSFYLKF
jgi:hypothetical protein